jgi:septum site-determining protein MinD
VVIATNTGVPLVLQKDSNAGQAFRRIALRLNGQKDLPIEIPHVSKSFWKRFSEKIGLGK